MSPGLIPGTGLGRDSKIKFDVDMADAKSVPEGKQDPVSLSLSRFNYSRYSEWFWKMAKE